MDNGNVGRGNNLAQDFECSMAETPQFNPEILPVPEDKEKDRGNQLENVGNNPNANNNAMYLDPSILGASAINAAKFGENGKNPALGEVIDGDSIGMRALTEDQITGADVEISKFSKDGISNELAKKLDENKKVTNLYRQTLNFVEQSKRSLSESFADRRYLSGDKK